MYTAQNAAQIFSAKNILKKGSISAKAKMRLVLLENVGQLNIYVKHVIKYILNPTSENTEMYMNAKHADLLIGHIQIDKKKIQNLSTKLEK